MKQAHDEDFEIDFNEEVNLPKPPQIVARLMVMALSYRCAVLMYFPVLSLLVLLPSSFLFFLRFPFTCWAFVHLCFLDQ